MKMKRKILIGILILTFLFTAIPAIIPQSQASVSDQIQVSNMYNWTIVKFDLNDGLVNWLYPWNGVSKGNFSANISNVINPDMNLTITTINGDEINGTLSIGNITVTNVNQTEIGNILNLNYWSIPQPIGLIIPNNTDDIKTAFINADTGTFKKWNVSENNKYIMFEIEEVSGAQITTLVYEKSTGILVFADTYVNFGTPNHYIFGDKPDMSTVSDEIQVGTMFDWSISKFDLQGNLINWLYPWNGVSKGNFSANISNVLNPVMNLTITTINGAEINGTIKIGNITVTNVNQTEIGNILNLNYWSIEKPIGLIINNNTDDIKEAFINADPGDKTKWNVTEYKDYIMFEIEQTDGNQITTLVYNKTSGLLVFADTYVNFGTPNHYIIGVKPRMSDETPATPPIPGFELFFIFTALGILALGYAAVKKGKREEINALQIQ